MPLLVDDVEEKEEEPEMSEEKKAEMRVMAEQRLAALLNAKK